IYHIMLKIIYCDTINYIEKHLYDNTLFILPDSISLRNIEIYILRKKKHEYFPIENFYTIDSLSKKILGKNYNIITRFMERYIAQESLKDLHNYHELHKNENFITKLLDEYLEIKENLLLDKNQIKLSEFFRNFDERYSKYLERLKNGININGKILYYLLRSEMTIRLANEFFKFKDKKIVIGGFYYISPTLKYFIEMARKNNEINFISEPLDDESLKLLEKRLNPDYVEIEKMVSFNSEIYELPDIRREVKYIANFILEKIEQENLSYSDFVVSFPEAKKYQSYVEEIFNEYNIPYFLETRVKFNEMDFFKNFIEEFNKIVPNNLEEFKNELEKLIENLLIKYQGEYEGIVKMWNLMDEFFTESEALSISIYELKEALILYLSTNSFGRFYGNFDSVSIVDLGDVHFRSGKYLIIGGMNEENFPRPLNVNIIFRNESQGIYKRDLKTHEANEKYRLFSAIINFEKVIFTFPYFNEHGKRLLKTYFIDYIMKKGYSNPRSFKLGSSELVFNKERVFNEIDKKILISIRQNSNEELEDSIPVEKLKSIVDSIEFTPTHITTYNKCPRKFFFEYVLGIKYPEEALSPVNQGNYVHKILNEFYSKNKNLQEISKMSEDQLKRKIFEIVNGLSVDHPESEIFKNRLVRYVFDSIKADFNLNKEREVLGTELPFILNIGNEKIKGRIDRLDKLQDFNVIIDYKYSNFSNIKKIILKREEDLDVPGKDLNLPIYILWLLKVKKSKKFVAYYMPLKSRKKERKKWLYLYKNYQLPDGFYGSNSGVFYDLNFLNLLENKIKEIMKNIREYKFPKTERTNFCKSCEYRKLCGDNNGM
ncbi:MAG: PD-(D/E)XK nuclease family protein, partial [Thermoplasmata archaeon]